MSAADGAFDQSSEAVGATVDAPTRSAPARHELGCARATRRQLGGAGDGHRRGEPGRSGGPDVAVTPSPTAGATTVTLSATATDPSPGTGVTAAEWFEGADPGAGAATAMTASDGAFGGTSEGLAATIPTAGLADGSHVLQVRARDAAGNWGATATVTLTVSTPRPPPRPSGFADGFERGDLGAWTAGLGLGSSQQAVTAAARCDGAYGMQAVVTGGRPSYVQDATAVGRVGRTRWASRSRPTVRTTNTAVTDIFTALTGGHVGRRPS